MANIIYNEVYIFLVLLGCIVVIMTMIMVVKERTKEIGMMMALGLESKDILQLFVIEGRLWGASAVCSVLFPVRCSPAI